MSGSHLLSHAVSSIVPSAAWVLTVVFGMGTGIAPTRIATGHFRVSMSESGIEKKENGKLAFLFDFFDETIRDECRDRGFAQRIRGALTPYLTQLATKQKCNSYFNPFSLERR